MHIALNILKYVQLIAKDQFKSYVYIPIYHRTKLVSHYAFSDSLLYMYMNAEVKEGSQIKWG